MRSYPASRVSIAEVDEYLIKSSERKFHIADLADRGGCTSTSASFHSGYQCRKHTRTVDPMSERVYPSDEGPPVDGTVQNTP
jgi:hypothetical protein